MVYKREDYRDNLTSLPKEMNRMEILSRHCLSRCRPTYPTIENKPEISYDFD